LHDESDSSNLLNPFRAEGLQLSHDASLGDSPMHPTRNDMPESQRKKVAELLNTNLALAIDLQLQTKQAHWNV
jgi:hypothetical protein